MSVDPKSLVPTSGMESENPEEAALLKDMLAEATKYLLDQTWCSSVTESYLGVGVGGVVAAFLFRIVPQGDADDWLWVVVGDLPTAYIVTDRVEQPLDALSVYCEVMQGWVDAVSQGKPLDDEFPVDAPADPVHAQMLARRIALLKEEVIPTLAGAT